MFNHHIEAKVTVPGHGMIGYAIKNTKNILIPLESESTAHLALIEFAG